MGTISNTVTVVAANCTAADGSIDITTSGGDPAYTYLWSNGATTEDLSNLVSGPYTVTVTDASGCTFSDTYAVGNTGGGMGLSSTPTAATCGMANGGMALTVTGGTPAYTYLWSNGATGTSISGVPAGNYGVTVSDANGCALAVPIVIINIGNPVNLIAGDTTDASCAGCSDGAVDLTLDVAGAPYTFNWSNNATTEDLINVVPGTYNVTLTSVGGCVLDTFFVVSISTGLVELEGMSLKVYPNPSNGSVYVEFGQDPSEEIQIEVFNALGQQILLRTYEAQSIQDRIHIDINKAVSGTYMMKISSAGQYVTKRIVILKE